MVFHTFERVYSFNSLASTQSTVASYIDYNQNE